MKNIHELSTMIVNLGNGFGRVIHRSRVDNPSPVNKGIFSKFIATAGLGIGLASCGAHGATPDQSGQGGLPVYATTILAELPPTTLAMPEPTPTLAKPDSLYEISVLDQNIEKQKAELAIFRAQFDAKTGRQWNAETSQHEKPAAWAETETSDYEEDGCTDNVYIRINNAYIREAFHQFAVPPAERTNIDLQKVDAWAYTYDPKTQVVMIIETNQIEKGNLILKGDLDAMLALTHLFSHVDTFWYPLVKGFGNADVYVVEEELAGQMTLPDWEVKLDSWGNLNTFKPGEEEAWIYAGYLVDIRGQYYDSEDLRPIGDYFVKQN